MIELLTASRLRCARLCQRLHKYRYLDGYRPVVDAEPLRLGWLVHRGLEHWWKAPKNRLSAALSEMCRLDADAWDLARAEAMLTGYDTRWRDIGSYELLGVEVPFEMPLINPDTGAASKTWRLAGRIDAVVRELSSGRILIVEHKTATGDIGVGSDYWKRLKLDAQISIYFAGCASIWDRCDGCIYDVLGKPGMRPFKATPPEDRKVKKDGTYYSNVRLEDELPVQFRERCMNAIAEDPNRYYVRGEVVRLDSEMDDAMSDVWAMGKMLREQQLANRFPRNVDSCVQYNMECPFFGVCCGEESLENGERFTRLENVNPELPGEEVKSE